MTLSRIATVMLAATVAAAAPAQSLTAEQAMANHKRAVERIGNDCADEGASEEIVVCARRTGPSMRLPLPVQPEPGARVNGEAVSATTGLQPQRCTAWGPNQSCNGGLPLLPIAAKVAGAAKKIVEQVVDPD